MLSYRRGGHEETLWNQTEQRDDWKGWERGGMGEKEWETTSGEEPPVLSVQFSPVLQTEEGGGSEWKHCGSSLIFIRLTVWQKGQQRTHVTVFISGCSFWHFKRFKITLVIIQTWLGTGWKNCLHLLLNDDKVDSGCFAPVLLQCLDLIQNYGWSVALF